MLKKLDIPDFRHLSKDKGMKFASMLPNMDPEVAKKALEQFPEFANTAKEMLVDYKLILEKGMESNEKSIVSCYDASKLIIDSLQKELEDEELEFEERKYIIDKMLEVSKMMNEKDTENKKFILGLSMIAGAVVTGVIGVAASVLGGNSQIELADDELES